MSLPNGSQEGVKVSPVVKGAILVCVAAVIGLVMVFAARNDGKQGGENNSSPTESASSTSSGNEETDKANEEDKKDPEYSEVYAKGQKQAEAYWNDRFLECDKGRWFSVEETETGRRYLELRIDRLGALAPFIVTIPPTRFTSAQRYNHEWFLQSAIRANAHRWCSESGPCGDYEGGMTDAVVPYSTLTISVKKRNYSLDDPLPRLYAPKSCEEIRQHPIYRLP